MTTPKAVVLRTGGTNCEHETQRTLNDAGAEAYISRTEPFFEAPSKLRDFRIIVFAGGFSYGDDLAAGRVWGLETRTHLGQELRRHVDGGGIVLGVCNGFQVLVESGLFEPDRSPEERSMSLYANASNHYECRWVTLEERGCACPWLEEGTRFPTPVAHAEGRFVVEDDEALARLRANGQVALQYVSPARAEGSSEGDPSDPLDYPHNPNGSVANIAGICDPSGRVLGLMPHPERNSTSWNHPTWTRKGLPRAAGREEGEGLPFYRRMVEVAAAGAS